tara:strand:+ start:107 stop:460 length:354 start_codon:yes stop_codon:yes gene_type:complete
MKKIFSYCFLFLIISEVGFTEQYSCAADLTRYGRPGEIENKFYKREGNFFYNHLKWKFQIYFENNEEIQLILKPSAGALFIVIINKKTKEFAEKYFSLSRTKKNVTETGTYGKCVVG